jgi:hypothetical protein
MAVWKNTYTALFTEADEAKEAAKAAFLAGLVPPNPPVLPLSQVIPLADAITTAQWKALLKHIGPVSSDGSVTFGTVDDDDGVPQLDIRSLSGLWEHVTVDPSESPGLDRPVHTIVWQDDIETPALPLAIWVKNDLTATAWSKLWPGPTGPPGTNGATWSSSTSVPSGGTDGDFHLKTDTQDVYKRVGGTWSVVCNIKGVPGSDGATWSSGTGVPTGGNSGDFYLKTDTYDVYKNTTGTWAVVCNIKGATGAAGAVGGAISIGYTFSTTTTDSDPGDGNLRLDNATQNLATTIRADLKDSGATDWTAVLATFADSTNTIKAHIRLFKTSDTTKWLLFSVSAIASPSGYKNITVACVGYSAASPFSNGDSITLSFTRAGDKGATGAQGPATLYYQCGIPDSISGGNPVGFVFGNDNTSRSGLPSYATNGMQNAKTIFPWIAPVAGTITGFTLTMEGAAISQGGPVSGSYMRVDVYKAGYNSETSQGSTNVSLNDAKVGVNNTTSSGNIWQTVTVTGLTYSVTQGDAVGIVFVPQSGNNAKINAILNLFMAMHFTPT